MRRISALQINDEQEAASGAREIIDNQEESDNFQSKVASMLDNGFQAQILAEVAQDIKEGFTGNQAGNVPFFFAQALASGIMLFQPKLNNKMKFLHLVLVLYSITRITLSLYLFYSSEVCTPNPTTKLCKTDYALELFYKGFLLFASISAKAAKYNQRQIELKKTTNSALTASMHTGAQGSMSALSFPPRVMVPIPREPFGAEREEQQLPPARPKPYAVFDA